MWGQRRQDINTVVQGFNTQVVSQSTQRHRFRRLHRRRCSTCVTPRATLSGVPVMDHGHDRTWIDLALYMSRNDFDNDEYDDDDKYKGDEVAGSDDLRNEEKENDDWRAFRAQLVGQSTYEVGSFFMETGLLLLSNVEDRLGCHDLFQPYLHKAVILLVLLPNSDNNHDNKNGDGDGNNYGFVQGILLNRPTDFILTDEDILYDGQALTDEQNDSSNDTNNRPHCSNTTEWKIQYGGDLAGPFDEERNAMIVCLFRPSQFLTSLSLSNLTASADQILPDLYMTSHAVATTWIQQGYATVDNFVCFYGFCGWEPATTANPQQHQLQREIQRGSWTVVSTTTDVLWNQLQLLLLRDKSSNEHNVTALANSKPTTTNDNTGTDPSRAAGISMWQYFRQAIGRDPLLGHNAFADLMLKAWSAEYLSLGRHDDNVKGGNEDDEYFTTDDSLQRTIAAATKGISVAPGMLFRAARPFLWQEQYLHKAIVLVLADDDDGGDDEETSLSSEPKPPSVGLILNLPTTDTYTVTTPAGNTVTFHIRYGGPSGGERSEQPLLWLHCSRALRKLGIGTRLRSAIEDDDDDGINSNSKIYSCSVDQVMEALDLGLALPREFLVVQGFAIWEKYNDGAGGLRGQILAGNLECIPSVQVENVWTLLQSQEVLSEETLQWNVQNAMSAWTLAGLGQCNENEKVSHDTELVYDSNVTMADLADAALGAWMTIFLLGDAEYAPFSR